MNNKKAITPSAEGIAEAARAATKSQNSPPVMSWNPPFCGDLDIRSARKGTWFYLGTPMGRFELGGGGGVDSRNRGQDNEGEALLSEQSSLERGRVRQSGKESLGNREQIALGFGCFVWRRS